MKKTLLTLSLLAVSSLAAKAAGWSDSYIFSENGTPITLSSTTTEFTAVAVVDVDAMKSVMLAGASNTKYTLIEAWQERAEGANGNEIGLQTNFSSNTSGKITSSGLYGTWNQGGAYSFGMDNGFQTEAFWTNVDQASVVLTYSYSTGTTAIFTAVKNDGSVTSLGGTWNSGLKSDGMQIDKFTFDTSIVKQSFVFSNGSTVEQATQLGYTVIPEPATATLSLLALAGLAARRRRR